MHIGQIAFPLMMMGVYCLSGYYNEVFRKSRLSELMTTFKTNEMNELTLTQKEELQKLFPDLLTNRPVTIISSMRISNILNNVSEIKKDIFKAIVSDVIVEVAKKALGWI